MNDFMKLTFWRRHGLNFLMAAASLLALTIATLIHSRAQETLQAAKSSYEQQQAVNLAAEQSAVLLKSYLPLYKTLQVQGMIGAPQRLQWLETLYASVNQFQLPQVTFNISPTEVASAANTSYTSDTLVFKVTPMRLEFTLLHEGDFYRLMTAMLAQAKGLFSTQTCEIRRSEEESSGSEDAGKGHLTGSMKGQCDLLWYSLADITQAWEVSNDPAPSN